MNYKKIFAVIFILFFSFSLSQTVSASGISIPDELDFVSEDGKLPINWQAYRETFESFEHPFMLVREKDFEFLRSVQDTEPWKSLKENAKNVIENHSEELLPEKTTNLQNQWENFSALIGDYTLMYILDTENQKAHKTKIVSLLDYWDRNREINLYDGIYTQNGDYWTQSIPPANALVNSVLALDIIYPSLTEAEINHCENLLEEAVQKFFDHLENHHQNVYGVRALWAAYTKNYDVLYENYSLYMQEYAALISETGFTVDSFSYAWGRFASDGRLGKMIIPVLVRRLGISNQFFEWEPMIRNYETIANYYDMPNGTKWLIGDTKFSSSYEGDTNNGTAILPYYASYFSESAAANSAWFLENRHQLPTIKMGTLVAYLLCENTITNSVAPKSAIFSQGGAFLHENMSNRNSISCFLYNLGAGETSGHGRNQTNSLSVAGYGQSLIANAGYKGFGDGSGKYTWLYFRRPYSASTVLIDYDPENIYNPTSRNSHIERGPYPETPRGSTGVGITKSLITDLFGYASGDSGESGITLPNGRHIRNTALIGAQDGVNGYFAVFDEIKSDSPEVKATIMWRPMSDDYKAIDGDSWTWHITAQEYEPADVTIHTTEQCDEVNFVDGICAGSDENVSMKCLEAKFLTNKEGIRNVGTIIFPSNEHNPLAKISRFEADGLKGSRLDFGNGISDYVLYSLSKGIKTYHIPVKSGYSYERIQLNGSWAICRKINGSNGFMFAMDSTSLLCGEQGFSSTLPVDFYIKEGKGKIVCTAQTSVTLRDYGIKDILVNGTSVEKKSAQISHTIILPEGENEIELVYDENKRKEEIISSKLAHGVYSKLTAIDTETGDVILNGLYMYGELKHGIKIISGTSFVSKDLASVLGISLENEITLESVCYIPLRKNAENSGYTVYWDKSGFILLVPDDEDFNADSNVPLIGITSLIFNNVYQTQEPYTPPEAKSISVNGKVLSDFIPSVYNYSFNVFEGTDVPLIEVDTESNYLINKPDKLPGTAEIILGNSQYSNPVIYKVNINTVPIGGILNVEASAAPQKENPPQAACDGDLSTRWSANGEGCWIVFDLGADSEITGVETAWFKGNTRVNYYDIEFSSDNQNWTLMFSGESSGKSDGLEQNKGTSGNARYVRVKCNGASTTTWNSLSECKINVK